MDALHGFVELDYVGEPEGSHTGLSLPRVAVPLLHRIYDDVGAVDLHSVGDFAVPVMALLSHLAGFIAVA